MCPAITAAPNCDDCGGDNGNQECIGTYGYYTNCPCYDPPYLKWAPLDSSDLANMAASFAVMTESPIASTTSSSAAPAETTPILVCQGYATYYDGLCTFRSVSNTTVYDTAKAFQNQYPNGPMTSTSGNITQVYSSNPYDLMNVGWIGGCTGPSQSLTNPVASDPSIQGLDLFRDIYLDCTDNNGVGGWYDVGCLRYGFYPTLIDMGGAPPNATLFFEVGTYCPS